MHIDVDHFYQTLRALNPEDYHRCFYCGCIACTNDYVPPRDQLQHYFRQGMTADFLIIPTCKQCATFLKSASFGNVEQRRDLCHNKIKHQYRQAIHVYLSWTDEELEEMDGSLYLSIKAGLKLGEESLTRSSFLGFDHEIDGHKGKVSALQYSDIYVFGERFSDLKQALITCCKRYSLNSALVSEALVKLDNNLEAAILEVQDQQIQKIYRKELNQACLRFAKLHRLSRMQVVNAVERHMDKNPGHDIEQALEIYYQERVQFY